MRSGCKDQAIEAKDEAIDLVQRARSHRLRTIHILTRSLKKEKKKATTTSKKRAKLGEFFVFEIFKHSLGNTTYWTQLLHTHMATLPGPSSHVDMRTETVGVNLARVFGK